LVDGLLLAGRRFQQVLRARQLLPGKGVLRLELRHSRFVGVDLGLIRRLFEQIEEEVALLDFGTFDELPLFEKRGHARDQRHAPDRLNAPD
jgi:hypothetical protein